VNTGTTAAFDLNHQSIEVPNSRKPGQTGIYRSAIAGGELVTNPPHSNVRTLYENLQNSFKLYGKCPYLGTRYYDQKSKKWSSYVYQSYSEVAARASNFGSGLQNVYQKMNESNPNKANACHVGLYSVNRAEWVIADQGCVCYSNITVALYDTLGPDTVHFILNHAEIPIVVASKDRISNLLQVKSKTPNPYLQVIISMDDLDYSKETDQLLKSWAKDKGIELLSFKEVEKMGELHPIPHRPPKPDEVATICYTSGTTGNPKGAMISHRNLLMHITTFQLLQVNASPSDIHISYLPLAHIFERALTAALMSAGTQVGFYRGDVLLLVEDIVCLKPTVFISVPRLYNRIYSKIVASTVNAPGIISFLFRRAFAEKRSRLLSGNGFHHPTYDRLLFSKIRAVLGGRIRIMISGSAPLDKEIMTFLKVAFSCEFLEGYGQTENAATCTIQIPGEYLAGSVGAPVPAAEIKLVDVPDMNYFATDKPFPRGEIWSRGPGTFLGYWKDPEKTKETIDPEGWLQTGDIGLINERGQLVIIDRKKNLLKLSQGEYVAPEKIENCYLKTPLLAQIFVHGESLKNELVAIVVPNPDTFNPWLQTIGYHGSFENACRDPGVTAKLLKEMDRSAKKAKLLGFEIVKGIYLYPKQFGVEDDLITPTFKLKRPQLRKYFQKEISNMYQQIESSKTSKPKL